MATKEQVKASQEKAKAANQAQFKKFQEARKSQQDKRVEAGTNLSQKERALKSGGRFSEGGVITTVVKCGAPLNAAGGQDFKINLSEELRFSDEVRGDRVITRRLSDSISTRDKQDSSFESFDKSESDFIDFSEKGEVRAPPIKEERGIKFKGISGNIDINFDRLFKDPDIIQTKDTIINVGRDLLKDPFLLGSAADKTLLKKIDIGRGETSLDLAFEGKLKESFEKEGARSSFATALVLGLSPLGGKSAKGFKIDLSKASREKQINLLQSKFPELKGTAQIIPEKSLVKTEFVDVLGGKKSKAIKFKKTTNIKQELTGLGDESVILGGATEGSKAAPLFIVKFGKGKTIISQIDPKQTAKVIEGAKAGETVQLTKGAKIAGGLSKTDKKLIGAEKTFLGSDFRFTATPKTSTELINLQKGLESGSIKQFAEVKTTNLENVLRGKPESIFRDIKKPKDVFAQTKAEKLISNQESFRNVGKPSTPLDLGGISEGKGAAGSIGKSKIFTQEQTKIIKDFSTPTKTIQQKKEPLEILFSAPRNLQQEASGSIQIESLSSQTQDKKSSTTLVTKPELASGLNVKIIEGVKPKQTQSTKGLIGSLGFKASIETNLIQGDKTTQTPAVTLKITDDLITKITTKPKLDTPLTPPPSTPPIFPEIPIEPPIKIVPILGAAPPISSRDFDTPSKPLGKKKGFFGNVPQDAVIGIVRKAPIITISEGRGFLSTQFKQKKEKKKDNILGIDLKIGLGSTTKRGKKTRQKKSGGLNIFSKSNTIKITL